MERSFRYAEQLAGVVVKKIDDVYDAYADYHLSALLSRMRYAFHFYYLPNLLCKSCCSSLIRFMPVLDKQETIPHWFEAPLAGPRSSLG